MSKSLIIDLKPSEASFLSFFSDNLNLISRFEEDVRLSKALNELRRAIPARTVRISEIMLKTESGARISRKYSQREVFMAKRFISAAENNRKLAKVLWRRN